jgi:hypothetical protein
MAKKTVKKTAKKSIIKKPTADAGYKGHRKGTIKERLHLIFDQNKKDPDKARELALKLKDVAPGTITTSFSQFRNADK